MKKIIFASGLVFLFFSKSYADTGIVSSSNTSVVKRDSVVTTIFSISNLGCRSDASNMEKTIYQERGVKKCTVDVEKGVAIIKYDAKKTSAGELTKVIEDCSLCHDKTTKPFKVTSVE